MEQIQTCPDGQVWKLWLCCLCNSRTELSEIGQEIDEVKDILLPSRLC
ncbi:MAG: hypothetical protein J6S57_00775 [Alphaproteobacteria bacterium]|nr:hypothetical protein [Alphaproteobacteria bacterium]